MREILFRGKSKNNGKWVYGDFCQPCNIVWVDDVFSEVCDVYIQEETLGQYTGLKDKNGKKIFEGDIVKYFKETFLVNWGRVVLIFMMIEKYPKFDNQYIEVIGNIHDNPELLGGVESGT